jgi:large subunit ribosomal protein L17
MRHRRGNIKLNRATDQRLAMLHSMVRSLFLHGKVKVTLLRAKEAKKIAERIIALTKHNDLAARRQVEAVLKCRDRGEIVKQIFTAFPERFEGRAGGFTRITKIGKRRGDAAEMAVLELL